MAQKMQFYCKKVKSNLIGSFIIVTKKDQTPVTKGNVSITPEELKGKFIVPDMQS